MDEAKKIKAELINPQNKLIVFQDKNIRRIWQDEEWFYSVVDIVGVLTDSKNPRDYWYRVKKRAGEEEMELSTICRQLKVASKDGKKYTTDCSNIEGIFRIIQSISSPKAEPFKRWLAQVGKERLDEIENPELAQERMKDIYEQKGYPKDWIDKRLRGIAIRQNLTDEWQQRGIKEHRDYTILTAEISKAIFGMTPSEYKAFKNMPVQSNANLRDNMDDLELIFTMLGERVTTEIFKEEKSDTFAKNKQVAYRGGHVAGNARKETEKELGRSIISKQKFLVDDDKTKLE
ncbi:BRO-N domain-containing protein [Candidatus Thioglobus sp.]|uniref:BRO-N domain-containing protein n=1 Tax=Candidatus Thioglobus sp. TaxID=2026721 RepID=UPI003D14994F